MPCTFTSHALYCPSLSGCVRFCTMQGRLCASVPCCADGCCSVPCWARQCAVLYHAGQRGSVKAGWGRAQLPKTLREKLREAGFRTGRSSIHAESTCSDGTRKFLLRLQDDRVVETVGIPVDDDNHSRLTVCVSSQVRHPHPPALPPPIPIPLVLLVCCFP